MPSCTKDDEESLVGDIVFVKAIECSHFARALWLSATKLSDMQQVESLYRRALQIHSTGCEQPHRKRSKNTQGSCNNKTNVSSDETSLPLIPLTNAEYLETAEKYCLLLCQSGKANIASPLLSSLGFTCRLSENILDYPYEFSNKQDEKYDAFPTAVALNTAPLIPQPQDPCIILDNFVDSSILHRLKTILQDPLTSYWTSHEYSIEPPSPYFSYLIPIRSLESYGFLGHVIDRIFQSPYLRSKFPSLKEATQVEMWAHNRPHASGHQLHFDSDNEGRGGMIRNPLISTVLYITAEDGCGGPSIVTNQTLKDRKLATRGWMCHPKVGRLVAFDGKVLHGVVPGKGVGKGRRVTLMFAFWRDIRIRDDGGYGAARSFPLHDSEGISWAREFLEPFSTIDITIDDQCVITKPYEFHHIYENLDGEKWCSSMGFPTYDEVFQGF